MYLVVWKAYNIFSFLLPTVFNRQGVYGQPYCPADREGLDRYRVNDQQYPAVSRKVFRKKAYTTIPKGIVGSFKFTVP